jgi:hypothetical protein
VRSHNQDNHSDARLQHYEHYDIVRKDEDRYAVWLESADDLSAAEERIEELTSVWPGEFQVVDQRSHQIVAKVDRTPKESEHDS